MHPSELTHEFLDARQSSSIAHHFGRYALGLEFESLPDDVVHQAKRSTLDALGCALGAYELLGETACERAVRAIGGHEEATVIGSGLQTSAPNAALANSFLVRYLDYNDTGGGGHNSDGIPALLAAAEREHASGPDFLTSVVVSYELGARVSDATGGIGAGWTDGSESRAFNTDIRGGLNMPPALGRLLDLDTEQIANAMGSCACRNLPLGIIGAHHEELTNMKSLRFGSVAYDALLSCLLAANGFTAPVRVVEGEAGMNEVVFDGDMDLDSLIDTGEWKILDTKHKTLAADHTSHGHLCSTISIVEEHDLDPDDIESVEIRASEYTINNTFNSVKKYPRTKETADHSGYYLTAYAVRERTVGYEAYRAENYTDPTILSFIERVSADVDPDLPPFDFAGSSRITTTDGEQYRERSTPPGFDGPGISDSDLEEKFKRLARPQLTDEDIFGVIDTVWNLEEVDEVDELTEYLHCE